MSVETAAERIVKFEVPGRPVPKGRPRLGVRTRGRSMRAIVYTPQRTRDYEEQVKLYALAAGVKPLKGELAIDVKLWLHGRRGDGDNYLKALADALNGIAYEDDRQVTDWRLRIHKAKSRSEQRAEITVWKIA